MASTPATRSITVVARAVSIAGHPLLLLSVALVAARAGRDPPLQLLGLVAGLSVFALLVMAYSRRQVRRGSWAHVDASNVRERGRLNRFLLVALLVGTLLAWWSRAGVDVLFALAAAVAIVIAALLSARWCKLSLHVAFAVFAAALLLRSSVWASAALLVLAALVGWSRLSLSRHAPRDITAGAVAGTVAGAALLTALQEVVPP